jgi:hypothetical protein
VVVVVAFFFFSTIGEKMLSSSSEGSSSLGTPASLRREVEEDMAPAKALAALEAFFFA